MFTRKLKRQDFEKNECILAKDYVGCSAWAIKRELLPIEYQHVFSDYNVVEKTFPGVTCRIYKGKMSDYFIPNRLHNKLFIMHDDVTIGNSGNLKWFCKSLNFGMLQVFAGECNGKVVHTLFQERFISLFNLSTLAVSFNQGSWVCFGFDNAITTDGKRSFENKKLRIGMKDVTVILAPFTFCDNEWVTYNVMLEHFVSDSRKGLRYLLGSF